MLGIRKVMFVSGLALAALTGTAMAQTTTDDRTTSPDTTPPTTPPYSVDVIEPNQSPVPADPNATGPVLVPVQPRVAVDERPVNVNVIQPVRHRAPMMAVSLGGGIAGFADSQIRDRTGVNGAYDARLMLGVGVPLAFEAAYVGTAVGVEGLAGERSATLLSNGVEGLARLNIGTYRFQPFVVGGASWVRYSVVNTDVSLSDIRDDDDVLAIPFGVGVAGYIPDTGFMLDARFIYRATFDDELVRPTTDNSAGSGLGNWSVTARLGYAF